MLSNTFTLLNGLRIVHSAMTDSRMVTLCVLCRVGARNEDPEYTGWAHLIEHLMFEGTPRIDDYDTRVQMAGGENNAFTNNDFTAYYITVPSTEAETAFMLEADRLQGISLDEQDVQVQKQVVIEEFKQRDLGLPYGDVQHLIRPLAFRVHPYRWPTIGITPEHIEVATPSLLQAFWKQHYHPSNVIVAVSGAITLDEVHTLADKYFAPIPDTPQPHPALPVEPRQLRMRRRTVRRSVPLDMLVMAWHMPDHNHPDFFPCDLISDLLANGQSSRLVRRLVGEQHLFCNIDAYISGSSDPGLISVTGRLTPGVTFADAEAAVWREADLLKTERVSERELNKVRNRYESERVFSYLSSQNAAIALAQNALYDITPDEEVRRYRAVTADDVIRCARRYLTHQNCSILHYKSNEG